jgi:hypothetical protein
MKTRKARFPGLARRFVAAPEPASGPGTFANRPLLAVKLWEETQSPDMGD